MIKKRNFKTPFDEYAEQYDKWYDENEDIYKIELNAIKKYIPKPKSQSSTNYSAIGLEIGVGTGRFAGPLGIKYGLEPSKSMADIAKKRGISVYDGVAESMPFKDDFFDYVLITTTLCFLKNPFKGLNEIKRVLKPGGTLIIGMIDKNSPLGQLYESKKKKSRYYHNAKFYELDEVLKWLDDLNYGQIIYDRIKLDKNDGNGSFVVICAKKSNSN
jgi:ubiquinone/menaquinone biosynthesis C-methylase UbiE